MLQEEPRRANGRRGPSFELYQSKLQPPPGRPAIVPRTAIVQRLLTSDDVPITSIVAPPGYGKTTLLSQWAEHNPHSVAWLSVDEQDNDPEVLLSYAAAALDRIEPIESSIFRRSGRRGSPAAMAAPRLAGAIAAMQQPVDLVLDHVELIRNHECLDTIAELALHLPVGSRLAIATRDDPPLPMARLRARGDVAEVGVEELAMDDAEARALLQRAGVQLAPAELHELIDRTEGWPVGLYLAALALKAGSREANAGIPFSGDDRLMADYLREEVLARLSDDEVSFLTRTAVLDRMCGRLCDAVLDAQGSGEMLESLERSNLLIVRLDRRREWYRYHHLFKDLLAAELERREPDLVGDLHARAATWCETHGMWEQAIAHSQQADDVGQVARLVAAFAQPTFASGRAQTELGWIRWLDGRGGIDRSPEVAIQAAMLFAYQGQPIEAERWTAVAESTSCEGTVHDGSTLDSWLAHLRVQLCRDGVDQMRRDTQFELQGLSPSSRLRPAALVAEGASYLLEGDLDRADPILAHGLDAALHIGSMPAATLALAERALIAIERDDWSEADALARRALDGVAAGHLDDYISSALVYAIAARASVHRGDMAGAREYIARAARLRPLLTYAFPHVSVQALLELTSAYIAVADTSGARTVLRQIRDILQQRPDLGTLPKRADELRTKLDSMQSGVMGASALTTAELRLVPFLSTHLTFPEIGERLHVSRHTVKTQAISIYQKLGVSSRSEAIDRMQQVGLLST
jgi:LuxR family transcriptional regulator, maltose regulon positive regulatory protein